MQASLREGLLASLTASWRCPNIGLPRMSVPTEIDSPPAVFQNALRPTPPIWLCWRRARLKLGIDPEPNPSWRRCRTRRRILAEQNLQAAPCDAKRSTDAACRAPHSGAGSKSVAPARVLRSRLRDAHASEQAKSLGTRLAEFGFLASFFATRQRMKTHIPRTPISAKPKWSVSVKRRSCLA